MSDIIFSEGSGLNDSIYGNSQAPLRMMIESRAESFEEKSMLKEIFMMDTSKHWSEKYTSMTSMSGFSPVGENGSYPIDGMQEGYSKTLEHTTWKNSFSISREIMEDGKLLDLKKKPAAFVKSYYRTREMFGAALLSSAVKGEGNVVFKDQSFSAKCADGQVLFSKTHPCMVKGSNQSNLYADDFSVDALSYAEEKMQNFRDDNYNILDVAPNTIIIPNDAGVKKAVYAAIGAENDPDTANNAYNFQHGRWRVLTWNYLNQFLDLSTKVPWILADTEYNQEYGGAIFVDRTPLDVRSTLDENTDANVWRGYARYTAGFNDWRAFLVGGVTGGSTLVKA